MENKPDTIITVKRESNDFGLVSKLSRSRNIKFSTSPFNQLILRVIDTTHGVTES